MSSAPTVHTAHTAPETSVLKAASEVTYFEKSKLFSGRRDVVLGEAMSRNPAAAMFRPANATTSVRNFRLTDVVLDADLMLLFKDFGQDFGDVLLRPA